MWSQMMQYQSVGANLHSAGVSACATAKYGTKVASFPGSCGVFVGGGRKKAWYTLPTHRSVGTRLLLSIKLKGDLNLNGGLSIKVNESILINKS